KMLRSHSTHQPLDATSAAPKFQVYWGLAPQANRTHGFFSSHGGPFKRSSRGANNCQFAQRFPSRQVYSHSMLPEIGIALAAGLALGFLIAWALGRSRDQAQSQRTAQLEQQLADRAATLETTQRERDTARQELAAQQQAAAERDAKQREEIARVTAERGSFEQDAEKAANAIEELRKEHDRARNELFQSQTELVTLRTTLEDEKHHAQEKLDMLTNARAELSNQFKAVAAEILDEKSAKLTEQNKSDIGNLKGTLDEFQKKIESFEKENITGRTELKVQIDNLAKLNTKLS